MNSSMASETLVRRPADRRPPNTTAESDMWCDWLESDEDDDRLASVDKVLLGFSPVRNPFFG
jgi:hypothetical protein